MNRSVIRQRSETYAEYVPPLGAGAALNARDGLGSSVASTPSQRTALE